MQLANKYMHTQIYIYIYTHTYLCMCDSDTSNNYSQNMGQLETAQSNIVLSYVSTVWFPRAINHMALKPTFFQNLRHSPVVERTHAAVLDQRLLFGPGGPQHGEDEEFCALLS